eukprot:scaffold322437_cov43-Prasinocladus_malaysianus.AAC.1
MGRTRRSRTAEGVVFLGVVGLLGAEGYGQGAGSCEGPGNSRGRHPDQPHLPAPNNGGFLLELAPGPDGQPAPLQPGA